MTLIFRVLFTAMLLLGGFSANTALAQTPSNCPVYANPQCQVDHRLSTADVPLQFQVAGCPTTMPVCVRSPESDEQAKRASNRCGSQQKFNQTTGRCENTSTACRPFLRLCQRGESPNTLCSCSPTLASDQGTPACVPALACPDNRVLNCDATYMASSKSCTVVSPTVPTSPTITVSDTTLLKQLEQCLLDYKTEMEKLRERLYGPWAKSSTGLAIAPSILQSQPWYGPWLQRCRDIMPGFNEGRTDGRDTGGSGGEGGGNAMSTETTTDTDTDTDTDSDSDSDSDSDGEGDGDGDGDGGDGGDE